MMMTAFKLCIAVFIVIITLIWCNCLSSSWQLMEMSSVNLIARGNYCMSTRQTAANELLTNMFRVRLGRGFYGECLVKLTFCSYLAEYFCSHSHEVFQSKVFYKIYVLACLIPHIISVCSFVIHAWRSWFRSFFWKQLNRLCLSI